MEGGYSNDTINFDRNVFGKKPDPNFGFSHDPYVQSSENPEKLKEIEKMKKFQFTMSKTSSNGFYNDKNKSNGMTQYQNNPNLTNFKQYQNLKKINNKMNYGGNIANSLGGVFFLSIFCGSIYLRLWAAIKLSNFSSYVFFKGLNPIEVLFILFISLNPLSSLLIFSFIFNCPTPPKLFAIFPP